MLSRLFLAAGVAALAIAVPAYAGPGGGHGGGGGNPHGDGGPHGGGGGGGPHGGGGPPAFAGGGGGGAPHGGGEQHGGGGPPAFHGGGGGGGPHGGGRPMFAGGGEGGAHGGGNPHWGGGAPAFQAGHGRWGGGAPASRGGGGPRFAAPQMRGFERQQFRGGGGRGHGHQQFQMAQRPHGHGGGQQFRMAERQHGHGFAPQQGRGFARQQQRMAQRQQPHGFGRQQMRQQAFAAPQQFGSGNGSRGERVRLGNQQFAPQQYAAQQFANQQLQRQQYAPQQFANAQPGYGGNWNASPYSDLAYGNNVQVLPVQQVERYIGAPVAQVAQFAGLSPLPADMQYLYPATPDYYYQYGDGYLYQVDRGTNLIDALVPLLGGGYMPGQYLPVSYMSDYVPDYYGLDSFYADDEDQCNRYYAGVVYQVDCDNGYVEDVVPVYAGGYGVGQLLPTAYSYYNVPLQYRGLYYDTPNYGYWYAPGAIYQYDQRTSVITSVAALMSPGFTVGQQLPAGYGVYNVPYEYRSTYYDTPNAWYRYNNGYIYQVDPVTQIVTAIVASLLT